MEEQTLVCFELQNTLLEQNDNFTHECRKKLFDTFIRDFKAYYD